MDKRLVTLLQQTLATEIKTDCVGCRFDSPTQINHNLCLGLTRYEQIDRYYDIVWSRIDFGKFIDLFKDYFRHRLFLAAIAKDNDYKTVIRKRITTPKPFYLELD